MKINFKDILTNFFEGKVFITPYFGKSETVRYKYKLSRLFLYVFLYTIAVVIFTLIILVITPLKHSIFFIDNIELKKQAEKTIELETKVKFLSKELQSISSANKRLEYAFLLGTSDSLDTNSSVYDSLKHESVKNLPYGGNLYFIFSRIVNKFFQDEKEKNEFFLKPSKGWIINEFNPEEGHLGIDFAVPKGTEIFASQGGIILFSDFTIDDGYKIILQHNNGYISIYKHCSSLIKQERDVVIQGEVIGFSGNSGENTTGPHLHFEIWKNGKPLNPKEIFIK
ncbi:MAG: hypothetical protein CR986_00955 [Ignavibacteriae bacterium]|nr:MAG: hypothetical protein CR986_00955 [Ignavibacteriota bacterium]